MASDSLVMFNQVHCYPYLSYPTGLQSVNPAWASCDSNACGGHLAAVFDPPRTLEPANALVPGPTQGPTPTVSASPGPVASDPSPAKTAQPMTSVAANVPQNGDQEPDATSEQSGPSSNDPGSIPSNSTPDTSDPSSTNPSSGSLGNNDPGNNDMGNDGQSSSSPGKGPYSSASQDDGGDPHRSKSQSDPNDNVRGGSQTSSSIETLANADMGENDSEPTIEGTAVSLASDALYVGTSGTTADTAPSPTPWNLVSPTGQPVTIPSHDWAESGSALIENSQSRLAGGTTTLLSHNTLTGGISTTDPPSLPSVSTFKVADQPVTAVSNGIALDGTTVSATEPAITVADILLSLDSSDLAVGPSTISLPDSVPTPIITIGSQNFSVLTADDGITINGVTLKPESPAATVAGESVFLGSKGLVVGGTQTISYESNSSESNGPGIGGFIYSGLNGASLEPSATSSRNSS